MDDHIAFSRIHERQHVASNFSIPACVRLGRLCAFLLLTFFISGCHHVPKGGIALTGARNLHEVNDDLFRGAQPNAGGLARLSDLGVKTVINLRETNDDWDDEERIARSLGMNYYQIPMAGLSRPTPEQVDSALKLIETAKGPIFIHCRRGADRTGTIIACFRIRHDGWSAEKALAEANSHGMSSVQFGMRDFVRKFSAITKP